VLDLVEGGGGDVGEAVRGWEVERGCEGAGDGDGSCGSEGEEGKGIQCGCLGCSVHLGEVRLTRR
jgi:hypothetical protein